MSAHLYWRFNFLANNGHLDYSALPEIEFRESEWGPNAAAGGVATASSEYGAGYEAGKALDGDIDTFWSSGSADPAGWWQYEFPSPVDIIEVAVKSFGTATGTADRLTYLPKDFEIQHSDDGVAWTTAWSVAGETDWIPEEVRVFKHLAAIETVHILPVTNGGAETGDLTGWTVTAGTWATASTSDSVKPGPHLGTYYFSADGSASDAAMHQDIAVPAAAVNAIDAGKGRAEVSLYINTYANTDDAYTGFKFLDGAGAEIGASLESRVRTDTGVWREEKIVAAVPAGTRTIRLNLRATLTSGSFANTYFDSIDDVVLRVDRHSLSLTNRDASDGLTGWTTSGGFAGSGTGITQNWFKRGASCFYGGDSTASSEAYQDLAVPASLESDIDGGGARTIIYWWQSCNSLSNDDPGRVGFRFLDSAGALLAESMPPFRLPPTAVESWDPYNYDAAIPVGTRTIRVVMQARRDAGTNNNAYFDLLSDVFITASSGVIEKYVELQWQLLGGTEVYSDPLDLRWALSEFMGNSFSGAWRVGYAGEGETYLSMAPVLGATFLEGNPAPVWEGEWKDNPGLTAEPVTHAEDLGTVAGPVPSWDFVQLPQWSAGLTLHFAGDWYYRIWIVPDIIRAQNPQIGEPIPFEILNAYPWTNDLTSISGSGQTGLELNLSAPSTFRMIELRTVDLTITPSAPIQIDAIFEFNFANGTGVFRFVATIADYVQMVPDPPITELWEWLTDVMVSHDATEQRVALRAAPRRHIRYSFLLPDEKARRIQYERWFKSLAARIVLPYYQYATVLKQTSASGGSKLYFDPALTDVRDGDFVIVLSTRADPEVGHLIKLGVIEADGATTASPLTVDLLRGWIISPAFTSRLRDRSGLRMRTVAGEIEIDAQALDVRPAFMRPGSTATIRVFDGLDVLDKRPLADEDVPETFDVNYEIIDSETGLLDIKSSWPHPFVYGKRRFLIQRRRRPGDLDWWRDFLYGVRGRQNPFLMPTWRADIPQGLDPDPGSSQLVVVKPDYGSLYFPHDTYKRLQIETDTGILWRKVLQVTSNGDGTQTLELDAGFGINEGDTKIRKISYLNRVRLNADVVRLTHGHTHTFIELDIRATNQ